MSAIRLRTCIATRERRPDTQLLRVVVENEDSTIARVVADPQRRLPGRGAWIKPDLSAYELAEKRRAFGRALRVSTRVDTGQVREFLIASATQSGGESAPNGDPSRGHSALRDPEIIRKTEH